MVANLEILDQKIISPLTVNILGARHIESKIFNNITLKYHPLTTKKKKQKSHYLNNTIFFTYSTNRQLQQKKNVLIQPKQ